MVNEDCINLFIHYLHKTLKAIVAFAVDLQVQIATLLPSLDMK